ncbi:MAG: hypothetical protein ACFFG0_10560, partial [Candidatus Thorarchaeota archaeon]
AIIISKIEGIFLPYPISIKISKEEVFLYPTNYIQKLEKMKEIIQKIEDEKNVAGKMSISHIMQKEKEKSIYLITELKIDFYKKKENLIREIYEFFDPIRIILSFILSAIFKINKIIIMKKKEKNIFTVKRYIKISTQTDINESQIPMVFNNYYLDVEKHLSNWGKDVKDKKEYLDFFNIFLQGKFSTNPIETKISLFWNSLENLANLFCKLRGWTNVMKKGAITKYNKMKKLIKPITNKISKEDFDIPNLTVEEFKEYQLCTINNYLTTKIRIKLLCIEIGLDYEQNVKNLIDLMSFIRNKLYHEGMPFFQLSNEIIRKRIYRYKSFDFQDLISVVSKFEILVQKIFLIILNLIPEHLIHFNQTNRFRWKSDPKVLETVNEIKNSNSNYYKDIFKRFERKKEYIAILKELEKVIEPSVYKLFQKDQIYGFLSRNENCYKTKISFDNEFKGKFKSIELHINELIKNKFLFNAITEDGLKLLFNFHIDYLEPQEPIRGTMKLKEFLNKYYKNQGNFSTLLVEIGF